MTLAGLRFNACEQKALGARAYRYTADLDIQKRYSVEGSMYKIPKGVPGVCSHAPASKVCIESILLPEVALESHGCSQPSQIAQSMLMCTFIQGSHLTFLYQRGALDK